MRRVILESLYMQKFIIQGGTKLSGSIDVKGAKNHALKVIAASILSEDVMTLERVPEIEDAQRLLEILKHQGARVTRKAKGTYRINTQPVKSTALSRKLVPQLRSSIVLTGPMLARFGKVSLPHPGGCAIGRRPIDVFISGFKALGVKHTLKRNIHHFEAADGLKGNKYVFSIVSVTGTETLMMAATLAKGKTTLINAALEPEILALAEYLNAQGAKITGAGTSKITIEGVERLRAGTCTIMPDRIEALSFLYLALATRSKLKITHCNPEHIENPLAMLKKSGARITRTKTTLIVHPWKTLKPMRVTTTEYPGFPTDGQPPLTVLLTQTSGISQVYETIHTDRLFYTDMLNRMGAEITMNTPQHISIEGPSPLRAKQVESPDLRAGIAMVIAAAVADGKTEIDNIYQIDRGYEAIDKRLRKIGLRIRRVS